MNPDTDTLLAISRWLRELEARVYAQQKGEDFKESVTIPSASACNIAKFLPEIPI